MRIRESGYHLAISLERLFIKLIIKKRILSIRSSKCE